MMNNKVLVEVVVPVLEESYDVFIPINKKIGNIIILLSKAVNELSFGYFKNDDSNCLYNGDTGDVYPMDILVRNSDIRNGSKVILM